MKRYELIRLCPGEGEAVDTRSLGEYDSAQAAQRALTEQAAAYPDYVEVQLWDRGRHGDQRVLVDHRWGGDTHGRMDPRWGSGPPQATPRIPPPPDHCPECGIPHDPDWPHNRDSPSYLIAFHRQHGRAPSWQDAIAHCPERIRTLWEEELKAVGAWTE